MFQVWTELGDPLFCSVLYFNANKLITGCSLGSKVREKRHKIRTESITNQKINLNWLHHIFSGMLSFKVIPEKQSHGSKSWKTIMHQMGINIICSTVVIKGLSYIQSSHFITVLLIAALLVRCIDYPHCTGGSAAIGRSFPLQVSPHPFHSNRKSVSSHWGILGVPWSISQQNQKRPWNQNKGTWSCTGVPLSAAQIEAGCL